jgi:hypothetical protein
MRLLRTDKRLPVLMPLATKAPLMSYDKPQPRRKAERITITADCLICGNTKQITGNAETWQRWKVGEVSSDTAFRNLNPTDRQWLLNGICPDQESH